MIFPKTLENFEKENFMYSGFPIDKIENIEEHCTETFREALFLAIEKLKEKNISITFAQQKPKKIFGKTVIVHEKDIFLKIETPAIEEEINIITMLALDKKSIKSSEFLAKEIIKKVNQHITAKKTERIFISSLGLKIDTRKLEKYCFDIDKKGYLRVNKNRICWHIKEKNSYCVYKADYLRSYTIIRTILENNRIILFDDDDLTSLNKSIMFIDVEKSFEISKNLLREEDKKDAENYKGKYFELKKCELEEKQKRRLYEVLKMYYQL
jgi:hypothetical protein